MFVLAIDQGTTSSRVVLVNQFGEILDSESKEFPQIFPQPGWVEHNPEEIWKSVHFCLKQVIARNQSLVSKIRSIGITNQRETVILWDRKTGKPVYNAIVWQCRRTSEFCDRLKKRRLEKVIYKKTGLFIDAYFSASKVHWILKNVPLASTLMKSQQLCIGTVDSYLLWKLTAGKSHKTDVSNASRTMLMNLQSTSWDPDLLKIFGVSESALPTICDSAHEFGSTFGIEGIPDGLLISGILGDQQAALFGQACFQAGETKCTFGTGSFILANTGDRIVRSKAKMLTTVAWKIPGKKTQYALEGGAFICGAAVQWLRDGLGIIGKSSEVESLAQQVADTGGVTFVPALSGLGAPYWDSDARGMISGMTRGTNRSHIALAVLEAMALQNLDILVSMEKDLGRKMKTLKVDGGATENRLLMQLQSDFLQTRVQRSYFAETTALGAAFISGIGSGVWSSTSEIKKICKSSHTFEPKMKVKLVLKKVSEWHREIKRSRMK